MNFASILIVISLVACSHFSKKAPERLFRGTPLLSKFMQVTEHQGKLLLTYVTFDENQKTESLMFEECDKTLDEGNCSTPESLHTGPFITHPRFHTYQNSRFVSWCETPKMGTSFYPMQIKLQQISPDRGDVFNLSDEAGFNCGQSIQIENDVVYVAYENATLKGIALIYKKIHLRTQKTLTKKIIAQDTLVRRPSLVIHNDEVVVGYDRWSAKNRGLEPVAPDYDVELAFIKKGKVRTEKLEHTKGLAQAPNLWAKNGELYLAYHQGPMILKHWQLRKWNGKEWLMPKFEQPFINANPHAENQGAEFPQIMGFHQGNPVLVSRPSHSAFVHFINGEKIETLDLDQDGWGARDMWMSGFVDDDSLYLARRGFKSCVLEKINLPEKLAPITWIKVTLPPAEEASSDKPIHYQAYAGVKFGDVHMHSAYSDGAGAPDEIYARAYARKLDFAALTDHDTIVASRLFPSQYYEIMMLTDLFDALPRFTTIQAFEWTTPPIPSGFGHKNVYFKGTAPVPVYTFKHEHNSTPKLYDALRAKAEKGEAFTAPHHTGWTGTDWENFDPKIQRHFEVASVHGVFEDGKDNPLQEHSRPAAIPEVKGGFARDGFKKGKQFGFIAGSDAHGLKSHHGHGRHDNPWTQGLTGVFSHSEKRADVFKALYDQKTFATTGPFSFIKTWVTPKVGNHHHHVDTRRLTFHYDVQATTTISELTLVWNGEVVWKKKIEGSSRAQGKIKLSELTGQAGDHHSLYLRAVQASEHQMNRKERDQVDIVFSGPLLF